MQLYERNDIMNSIKVVAAVIKSKDKDGNTTIFATQRGYGDYKGGWEFPGGKVEESENVKEALRREIMEELETEIFIEDDIYTVEYDYPTFHISMECFWCEIPNGIVILREHADAKWVRKEELDSLAWLPADEILVEELKKIEW